MESVTTDKPDASRASDDEHLGSSSTANDFSVIHSYLSKQSYSKTSNNGPSENRTTSVQRTTHLPPIDFTIELIHFEPPRSGHLSTPNNGH